MHYLWTLFLMICIACSTKTDCNNSKAVAIVKEYINSDSAFTKSFKEKEIKRKNILFQELCVLNSDLRNFILMEKQGIDPDEKIGIVYNYHDGVLYSYSQSENNVKIDKGNRFDRYGALSRILYGLKSDIVYDLHSLELKATENRIPDWTPIYIYYINMDSKKQKYTALR